MGMPSRSGWDRRRVRDRGPLRTTMERDNLREPRLRRGPRVVAKSAQGETMVFSRYRKLAVAVGVSAALLLAGSTPSGASEPIDPSELASSQGGSDEEEASRAFMTEFGVDPRTQDRLLARARVGRLTLADTGLARPVGISTFVRGGSEFEVATFADGSISVVEREIPAQLAPGMVGPMAVSGCTISGSSSYTVYNGCKVHYRTAVFSYGFRASFTQSGANATMSPPWGFFQEYAIGHTRQSYSLSIIRKTGNVANPAHIQLAIEYNVLFPWPGQVTKGVRLKAHGSKYWQENS